MGVEDVLKFAFYASKRHPRIVLPAVIGWIPTISITFVAAVVLSDFSFVRFFNALDSGNPWPYFKDFTVIVAAFAGLWWITGSFLQAFYIDITQNYAKRKRPNIATAFYTAKARLLDVMWINLLIAAFILFIIAVPIAALTILVPTNANVGTYTGLAASFYLLTRGWLSATAAVVENKRGVGAIRRSFHMTRGIFWPVALVMVTIGLAMNVASYLNMVPLVGYTTWLLMSLFLTVWSSTAPPAIYFEYGLGKRKN